MCVIDVSTPQTVQWKYRAAALKIKHAGIFRHTTHAQIGTDEANTGQPSSRCMFWRCKCTHLPILLTLYATQCADTRRASCCRAQRHAQPTHLIMIAITNWSGRAFRAFRVLLHTITYEHRTMLPPSFCCDGGMWGNGVTASADVAFVILYKR